MKAAIVTLDQARAAKAVAAVRLADWPVVGIGITKVGDGYGLKINLSERTDPLPRDVNGVPLQAEVVRTIEKR
jgi:hypothetical protein